jgi:beta-xylosidase
MLSILHAVACALVLTPAIYASPLTKRAGPRLVINEDFADPSFVQHTDGSWYAFATNGNGKRVQVAHSPDFQSWTVLNVEALPTLSGWETDYNHWAPDVVRRVRL